MPNFFDLHSPYLAHPLLTPERTALEIDHLVRILGVGPGATVLDIGCGFGRHSIEMATRGIRAFGIDPSEAMIAAANERAAAAGVDAEFRQQNGESLAASSAFDGAIVMFTTLGQINDLGADNRTLLVRALEALRPGAGIVVEVPRRSVAIAGLVTSDTFGSADDRTEILRRFEAENNRVVENFVVVSQGTERRFDLAYTLFEPNELVELLDDTGFTSIAVARDLGSAPGSGTDLASDAGFIIATAWRPDR